MYKASELRLPQFFRYVNKVYGFSRTIDSMKDQRDRADVSPQTVFTSTFIGQLLRFGSLNRLAFEAENKRLSKFLRLDQKDTFCANTIANGLENIDVDVLEHQSTSIPKKMRRNKVFTRSIGGFKIAAIDGTEILRSENIHCEECLEYHIKTKDGIKTEYVHRVVLMQMVGKTDDPFVQAILGIERILPKDIEGDNKEKGHEGELTAAKRLIQRMIVEYGDSFFDVITTDAIYANSPCVKLVASLGKYLVSRVTNERTDLYKEIESLSTITEPIYIDDREEHIDCWIYEIPNMEEWLCPEVPTRGFKIIEKPYKIVKGEKEYIKENVFLCMATLPSDKADGNVVRQIVHAKWGIENNGIKDLKDNWYLEHNYHHHPNAIYAILLILMMAYNLFYSYVLRHMKTYRIYVLTIKQIVEELVGSFIHKKWRMSWVSFDG